MHEHGRRGHDRRRCAAGGTAERRADFGTLAIELAHFVTRPKRAHEKRGDRQRNRPPPSVPPHEEQRDGRRQRRGPRARARQAPGEESETDENDGVDLARGHGWALVHAARHATSRRIHKRATWRHRRLGWRAPIRASGARLSA